MEGSMENKKKYLDKTVLITGSACVAFMLLTYSIKRLRENYQNSGWFGFAISGILITLGIGLVQRANKQMTNVQRLDF